MAAKSQCRMMTDCHCRASVQLLGGEGHEHRGTLEPSVSGDPQRKGKTSVVRLLRAPLRQSTYRAVPFCSEIKRPSRTREGV